MRTDSIPQAEEEFGRADRLCRGNLDAKVGLGYVALRSDRVRQADSLFRIVVHRDSANADAWEGLALAAARTGDRQRAVVAARRALQLNPQSQEVRDLLGGLDPDWDRPRQPPAPRPERLRVVARTRGERFEVPNGDRWKPLYVQGVNLGVALPGKYPSEFPTDSARYAGWLDTLAAMHANVVRLYTILPPTFYRALRAWNRTHPQRVLWLIQGVWTELPPHHDFENAEWKAGFRAEMRRVVDLVHGAIDIAPRPGHAAGSYDADVSAWTLAYIIGREWEPFAVKAFDSLHPAKTSYPGRYLAMSRGSAIDAWMAAQCDYMLDYEVRRHNTVRPIAYTNWPTLDPLYHITESTVEEERQWRARVGREIPTPPLEYENDAVGLDATLIRPTSRNPAGWFASFHAYPYYPDFMLYDPVYNTARSSEGRSNYFGYLEDLRRYHSGIPVLIAEYGVPSSRGIAHLQPQGWNHGGHDEAAMAAIDARLTREIREAGLAGGILFAWLDEWFKKNWIVVDYEIPLENTRRWHNMMDAEQNYGILSMDAGDEGATPLLGGDPARWAALPLLEQGASPEPAAPRALRIGADESYVYFAAELPGLQGRPFPWDSLGLRIALDTYRVDRGQHRLPPGSPESDVGFEFLADFRSPRDAELRIVPEYNPYVGTEAIVQGDELGRFARRPITITSRNDGRFDSLFVITNRARFSRDGRFYPVSGYNRGRLRYGTARTTTLADWYYDAAAGLFELRLPWGLLNVSDPSSLAILFEEQATGNRGTVRSDGFRIGVLTYRRVPRVEAVGTVPATDAKGRWSADSFPSWTWRGWQVPRYHQRLKPVYDSLRKVWEGQ